MKNFFLIVLFCFCLFLQGTSQAQTEREKDGWKGNVRSVEIYEIVFWGLENDQKSGSRNLRGLSLYNRGGDLIVSWHLTNDANGSYYEKHLYSYDNLHRKVSATIFRSIKTPRDTFFSAQRTSDGSILVKPSLAEFISAKILFEYNPKGKLIKETTSDQNKHLVSRKLVGYDISGNAIKYTFEKKDGSVEAESDILNLDNGQRVETTIRPGSNLIRSISYSNKSGTEFYQDGYTLKSTEGSRPEAKFVLTSRSIQRNTGTDQNEMVFLKPNGDPESKTVYTRNGAYESSTEQFTAEPLPRGSQNENIEPKWIAGEKTVHKNEYDIKNNLIKDLWLRRSVPSSFFYPVYIFDNVITYY